MSTLQTKDFDSWNLEKKIVNDRVAPLYFHAREIWWCSLGVNVGFEQDGAGPDYYRPVLILKCVSGRTCFVIPLTTSSKVHRFRPSIGPVSGKDARALLSQMRLIDTKRLVSKVCYLDEKIFCSIQKAVKDML